MKILLTSVSLFLFFTFNLLAKNCCFDGFYLGGGISGTILDGRQSGTALGTLSEEGATNFYSNDLMTNFFGINGAGELFGGFGYSCRCLYLGIEVFGQYSPNAPIHDHYRRSQFHFFPAERAFEGIGVNNSVSIGHWRYGIGLRPGFLLTPSTLLYGRVGFTASKIRYNTDTENVFSVADAATPIPFRESLRNHNCFLNFGLGLEKFFLKHFALRLEYLFTNYRSLSSHGTNEGPSIDAILTLDEEARAHLKTHELKLALSYYFSDCCPENFCHRCSRFKKSQFSGFYLGASLGGSFINQLHKIDATLTAPGPESPEVAFHPHHFNANLNRKTTRTTLWGGYSLECNRLFTALEAFIQYQPSTSTSSERSLFIDGFNAPLFTVNTSAMASAKIQPFQYGLQIRPGYFLSPSALAYATVGVSFAKLKARYDLQYDNPAADVTIPLVIANRKCGPAFRVGGGVEYDLCWCGFHIRADYVYTKYRSLKMNSNFSQFVNPTIGTISFVSNSKIEFRDHAFTIGLNKYL